MDKNRICDMISKEIDCIVYSGMQSGPQAVSVEAFLSKHIFLELDEPPSDKEVILVLNDFIEKKKLLFRSLQINDGKLQVFLTVP